ncbi:MAG: amidohydrolase [Methanobacteriota archaeon]|nr:MAG: amidohydrolase [Euryarchaeota archaeon]
MSEDADLVIRNGRVYTVNDAQPWTEAVAVRGDRIVHVGSDKSVEAFIGPETETIDLKGRMVLPGIIDAHVHSVMAYQAFSWADLTVVDTVDEALKAIEAHAREHPEHCLVGGYGFRYNALMFEGRLLGRKMLDAAEKERPVWLMSYDGWTGIANSRLLDAIAEGLGDEFDEIDGVEKDPENGEPTGVFYRTDDLEPRIDLLSSLTSKEFRQGLVSFMDMCSRWGVTSVHDALVRRAEELEMIDSLRKADGLKTRVYVAMEYPKHDVHKRLEMFEAARSRYNDEWVRVGAVKLFIDGVADSHTAALLEPYSDRPSSAGKPFYSQEEFDDIVKSLDEAGFQCITHSCGDRGVRVALNAYEHVSGSGGNAHRHRIEHVENVSDEDIARFGPLGVIASMQPVHADLSSTEFDDVYFKALGEERIRKAFPWKSLVRAGAVLAFSSDWPVANINPFLGMQTATTRGGLPGRENVVSLEEAIRGYTINAAYASFEEGLKGSIEPDKLADLVVLSENLFEIPVDAIKSVEPVLTIVGGKQVYRKDM